MDVHAILYANVHIPHTSHYENIHIRIHFKKIKHIHTRTNPITQHTRTYTHERTRERTPAKREGK